MYDCLLKKLFEGMHTQFRKAKGETYLNRITKVRLSFTNINYRDPTVNLKEYYTYHGKLGRG